MKSARTLPALLFAVLILAVLGAPAASAQSPSPSSSPSRQAQLEVKLVDFPVSVGPADSLTVGLQVTNSGSTAAGQLEVALTIFQGVTSRSRLEQTYENRSGTTLAVDTIPVEGTVAAGRTRQIEIAKPLSELAKFRNSTQDRAYPVRVVVRSGRVSSNAINTHMIFFHEPPERPLGLSLVVPLHSPSAYTDGGKPDLVTSNSLERSITGGRLSRILDALEAHPEMPVTLAPSGLLLSMLQDMADGYMRATSDGPVEVVPEDPRAQTAFATLARLQGLAARPNTRVITTTYSPTSLPAFNRFGLPELAATQLSEGRNVLLAEPIGLLRSEPLDKWLLPTFGDLDQPTLTQLHRTDFNRLIISSRSIIPSDDPFSRALPVQLQGGPGSATEGLTGVETEALVADAGLERELGRSGELGTIEARQRFVAETATIHLETPGLFRAVVAKAPADWEARGESASDLMDVLASSPWLRPTTPDAITAELEPPETEQVRLVSSADVLENGPDLPPESYFTALSNARRAIARYSTLSPPSSRIGSLSRRLLIAESTDWWSSRAALQRGLSFAEAIPASISAELRKLQAPDPQTITLTSRTGIIPLSVGSGLEYPVDVVLQVESDKLRFPDGNRVTISKLQPPNHTIQVRAITQSSGTFPLNVQLFTPDGTLISDSQLTIRSTAYNVVALWITGAAALFMVGWWVTGWLRRRLPGGRPEAEQGAEEDQDKAEPVEDLPSDPAGDSDLAPVAVAVDQREEPAPATSPESG
ncbi:hypothetical protein BH23ACT12_BH23ACT12_07340 [soil metagenome]